MEQVVFELWSSDGTSVGTQRLLDIQPGADGSLTQVEFTTVAGEAYFAADDGSNGSELWKTDGTESGTTLVADINDASDGTGSAPRNLTAVGSSLFFSADDGTSGRELWESDGTAVGTRLVRGLSDGFARFRTRGTI